MHWGSTPLFIMRVQTFISFLRTPVNHVWTGQVVFPGTGCEGLWYLRAVGLVREGYLRPHSHPMHSNPPKWTAVGTIPWIAFIWGYERLSCLVSVASTIHANSDWVNTDEGTAIRAANLSTVTWFSFTTTADTNPGLLFSNWWTTLVKSKSSHCVFLEQLWASSTPQNWLVSESSWVSQDLNNYKHHIAHSGLSSPHCWRCWTPALSRCKMESCVLLMGTL